MKNQFDLDRNIPLAIKRKIRFRSKNGCVICRCGIYQYEHIDPEFKDAKTHNPNKICCLCARCHDKVTRGQLSKQAVQQAYEKIQSSNEINNPSEFFDFHTGTAKLMFGGLICDPTPESVFRCYGNDVFSIKPGVGSEQGAINALFADEHGNPIFQIVENEWVGPKALFDLEIIGQRFVVRKPDGSISLQLRHEVPGKVIVERLDMRYADVHLLASEFDFALGKYNGYSNNLIWLHVKVRIDQLFSQPIAIEVNHTNALPIEFEAGLSAKNPGIIINQSGKLEHALTTDSNLLNYYNPLRCGIYFPLLGFQIAKGCAFAISAMAIGVCSIDHARKHFFSQNRMNIPSLYLPALINELNLSKEKAKIQSKDTKFNKYLKEPFLVLKDSKAIESWNERQALRGVGFSLVKTPFQDDKPNCYFAIGAIKLVDKYDGPAIRIKKG